MDLGGGWSVYLQGLDLGYLEPIGDYSRVQTLGDVSLGLLEELANQEHHRGGSISADVVLGRGSSRDHDRRRIRDLHLSEKHVAVFRQFDLRRKRKKVRAYSKHEGAGRPDLASAINKPRQQTSSARSPATEWMDVIARQERQGRGLDSHLDGPQRTQVRLQDILKTFAGADVDSKSFSPPLSLC